MLDFYSTFLWHVYLCNWVQWKMKIEIGEHNKILQIHNQCNTCCKCEIDYEIPTWVEEWAWWVQSSGYLKLGLSRLYKWMKLAYWLSGQEPCFPTKTGSKVASWIFQTRGKFEVITSCNIESSVADSGKGSHSYKNRNFAVNTHTKIWFIVCC